MHGKGTTVFVMSALIGCAISWVAPADVGATCLNTRTILYHLDEDLIGPSESIYVYINAPDDPNGPPCPQDVRRSGFSVEDFETIVNAAIASINDASSTKSGRVGPTLAVSAASRDAIEWPMASAEPNC
jgi:hypothetical protein